MSRQDVRQNVFYGFSKFFKLVLCQANKFKFQVPYPEKKCHGANFPSIPWAITRSNYDGGNNVNWTYWVFWYIELQAIF